MKDGEVDMITGWNGRFDVVKKDGANVAYTFNQALLDYDCYAIAKGAPNKDLAMKFLAEISKPQYQAEFTKYITYGPTNKKAYDLGTIEAGYAKQLPSHPDNAAKQLTVNLDWYIKFEGTGVGGLPEHADRVIRYRSRIVAKAIQIVSPSLFMALTSRRPAHGSRSVAAHHRAAGDQGLRVGPRVGPYRSRYS